MGIESYVGVDGPCIVVETPEDLFDALDTLHTQVMDNIGGDSPLLLVLETAMTTLRADHGIDC